MLLLLLYIHRVGIEGRGCKIESKRSVKMLQCKSSERMLGCYKAGRQDGWGGGSFVLFVVARAAASFRKMTQQVLELEKRFSFLQPEQKKTKIHKTGLESRGGSKRMTVSEGRNEGCLNHLIAAQV